MNVKKQEKNILSKKIFSHIFYTEYNLSFKRKHADTCKTCDEFYTSMASAITTAKQKVKLISSQSQHKAMADLMREAMKSDIADAAENNGQTAVLTFDLQKTLPTPKLSTSIAYYKRQLWTYNLGVYDEVERKGLVFDVYYYSYFSIYCIMAEYFV